MAITVRLTEPEMVWASEIAHRRQDEAVRKKLPDRHGFKGNGYQVHLLGAAGELAVAKALDVPWDATVNTFKLPDLGSLIQVKTRSRHYYDLLVRDDDRDDEIFILVTATLPNCVIHGWMYGRDAKQNHWKKPYGNREPAYFVPQSELTQLH